MFLSVVFSKLLLSFVYLFPSLALFHRAVLCLLSFLLFLSTLLVAGLIRVKGLMSPFGTLVQRLKKRRSFYSDIF